MRTLKIKILYKRQLEDTFGVNMLAIAAAVLRPEPEGDPENFLNFQYENWSANTMSLQRKG
ncbi:MAG: hypothetical protein ACLVB3_06090 [Clostridium sp.]